MVNFSRLVFVILLLSFACFALTMDEFVSYHLSDDESFSVTVVTVNGVDYTVVSVNEPVDMVVRTVSNDSFELVTSEKELLPVLSQLFDPNNTRSSCLEQFHNISDSILVFNNSRGLEKLCNKYTGTDKLPCSDRDSCKVACQSVPLCQGIYMSGNFLMDSILSFQSGQQNLTKLDLALRSKIDSFESKPSLKTLDETLELIIDINIEASRISSNPLMTDFFFCPTPSYNMTALVNGKLSLLNLKQSCRNVFGIQESSDHVTKFASNRLSRYNDRFEKARQEKLRQENEAKKAFSDQEWEKAWTSGPGSVLSFFF